MSQCMLLSACTVLLSCPYCYNHLACVYMLSTVVCLIMSVCVCAYVLMYQYWIAIQPHLVNLAGTCMYFIEMQAMQITSYCSVVLLYVHVQSLTVLSTHSVCVLWNSCMHADSMLFSSAHVTASHLA